MQKPDGLIFDLDGTLWDASQTYADSWNEALKQFKIEKTVTPKQVADLAGLASKTVVETLLPELDPEHRENFYNVMTGIRRKLIPKQGGILYPGVKDGLQRLAKRFPLFILSNCARGIIPLFIDWAEIEFIIADQISNGDNGFTKSQNIKLLTDKHFLRNPIYIGDTKGDSEQTHAAKIPFIWVSYGFGATENYELTFDSFTGLVEYLMEMKSGE